MPFDYSPSDAGKGTSGSAYVFDEAYLKNILSLGNLNPNWAEIRSRRYLLHESRLNYPLFFLKHPDLSYARDNSLECLIITSNYFDEEAYAFRVAEKPVI